VLFWFPVHGVEDEEAQFIIRGTGAKRADEVGFEMAAKTGP